MIDRPKINFDYLKQNIHGLTEPQTLDKVKKIEEWRKLNNDNEFVQNLSNMWSRKILEKKQISC